ncbi:MAG: translesion error-prone DNA polymerase V autoproteolytic subunit [Dehalococcoidia bacterium]|nr:translesion error-prone DNA polymerase V autoproteolytic subunit [Dehalococcoidia bacterium]
MSYIKKRSMIEYVLSRVSAGFPSPADDFIQSKIDINDLLIDHPASTYFITVSGNSMLDAGIRDGDLLIVDRSLDYVNGKIVIVILEGDFLVKKIYIKSTKVFLVAANSDYKDIEVTDEMNCTIWGVVTYVIHAAT